MFESEYISVADPEGRRSFDRLILYHILYEYALKKNKALIALDSM